METTRTIRSCYRFSLSLLTILLFVLSVWPVHAAEPAAVYGEVGVQPPINLNPIALKPGEKLKTLATTSIVGDVVKQIGGDYVEVRTLLPLGADPHTFEATPQDVVAIADAQVIFANGAGLEEFLNKLLQNAGGSAPVVSISDGIQLRQLAANDPDHHLNGDPHTWFSPVNVMVWTHNIAHALAALVPAQAVEFKARAWDYEEALAKLDTWIKEQVAQVPQEKRKLVTDHETYGYFADRYGFEQIGAVIPSFSTVAQPSAQELAQMEDAVRQHNVKAIFVSNTVNSALSKRVADDMGIKLVTLYHASLGPAGSGVESYLDLIRYNTTAIVNALK